MIVTIPSNQEFLVKELKYQNHVSYLPISCVCQNAEINRPKLNFIKTNLDVGYILSTCQLPIYNESKRSATKINGVQITLNYNLQNIIAELI